MSFIKSITQKFGQKNTGSEANQLQINTILSRLFHDLRNNFIAIRAAAGTIENNLNHEQINGSVEKGFLTIDKMLNQAMVRLELSKIFSEKVEKHVHNITSFSVLSCINEAIDHYPFLSKNDLLCVTRPNPHVDFSINGNPRLFKNIFYCLIKNGLHAVNTMGSGEIAISIENGKQKNAICFEYPQNSSPPFQGDLFQLGLPEDSSPAYGLEFIEKAIIATGGELKFEYKPNQNIAVSLLFLVE